MKIVKIESIPVSIPFIKPIKIATGKAKKGDHVIVKIYTDEEIVGYGETAPFPGWGSESQDDVLSTINRFFVPQLINEDPFDIERIIQLMDKSIPNHEFAKAAIETALWDIMGKKLRVPLYKLLGGCYRKDISFIELDLPIESPLRMAGRAKNAVEKGFRIFELKIGVDPRLDIEAVKAVREAIGYDVHLHADANQGYTSSFAIKILRKMENYDLDYIEQPVPRWDLDGMARIAKALDTPICADESAYTPEDVVNLIKKEAADIVCIKHMKAGGLYKAKRIAAIAEAAGIPCTVGSMLPFGVGTLALHHFVVATKNILEIGGVYATPADFYTDDILSPSITVENGTVKVPDAAGLGAEINEEKIKEYRKGII